MAVRENSNIDVNQIYHNNFYKDFI